MSVFHAKHEILRPVKVAFISIGSRKAALVEAAELMWQVAQI